MTPSAQLRAGIYDRESKGSDSSIKSQHVLNAAAVEDNGWLLVGQYTDGSSASRFGTKVRQDWAKFLADLDAGAMDVVVTVEASRADRDIETWVPFIGKCRKRGILIHLSGENDTLDPRKPTHWKRLIEGGVDAAFEVERLSVRTRRGVAQAAVDGGFHGGPPYGYHRVIVGEKTVRQGSKNVKKNIVEQRRNDDQAPIVVEIIERVARKDTLVGITADLNERGVPGPQGRRWNRKTVRKTALNIAYIGQRSHLGTAHQGTWEPISQDASFQATFLEAGRVLADPARVQTRPGRLKWLMSYLATGPCGAFMHYMPPRQGRPGRYHCVADGCASIAMEPVDEYVINVVIDRLSQPGARSLFVVPDDDGARLAQTEAARLRSKLAEARASFAEPDGISAASLAEIERRLTPGIEAADKRAIPETTSMPLLDLLKAAEAGERHVRPAWDSLAVPARREVLRVVLGDIRIGKLTHRLTRVSTPEERYAAAADRIIFGKADGTRPGAAPSPQESAAA